MTSTAWTCASVEPLRHPQTAGADRVGEGPVVEVPRRPGRRRPARCRKTSSAATKHGARASTDPPHSTQAMASEALIRRQQAGGEIRDVLRERERETSFFLPFAF